MHAHDMISLGGDFFSQICTCMQALVYNNLSSDCLCIVKKCAQKELLRDMCDLSMTYVLQWLFKNELPYEWFTNDITSDCLYFLKNVHKRASLYRMFVLV